MQQHFDLAVVGGGIVGLATAMALVERHPSASVVVLEAEGRLASHQTGNNSGVIHSGLYYKPGSLKAKLCTEGRDALYRFCAAHGVAHERCGKIVVATEESEILALDELERRGRANGLVDMRRLDGAELRRQEPHVRGIAGLYVQETGIVDYIAVANGFADVVRGHGGHVRVDTRLVGVGRRRDELLLKTSRGPIDCRALINCGGLYSDRVARLCGVEPGMKIVPFRGEYYKLSQNCQHLVKNLIYPVPDARFPFLGVHFTRMIGGGIEAGPNAVLALARNGYDWSRFSLRDSMESAGFLGFWRMVRRYWKTGFGEFYRSVSKSAFLRALQELIPELTADDLTPGGAGVRAQALDANGLLVDDFRIVTGHRMIHVLNAPSPAATASISIGRYIADEAFSQGLLAS